MLRRVVLSTVLLAVAATQPVINAQSPPGGFRFGAHLYYPDGHHVSTWREFGSSMQSSGEIFTTNSICIFQNDPKTSIDVGYGWRFDLTHVTDANGAPAVHVTWSRKKDRGQTVEQPSGSVVLTLSPGSSVPLDYITADPNSPRPCAAVGMLLEISRH